MHLIQNIRYLSQAHSKFHIDFVVESIHYRQSKSWSCTFISELSILLNWQYKVIHFRLSYRSYRVSSLFVISCMIEFTLFQIKAKFLLMKFRQKLRKLANNMSYHLYLISFLQAYLATCAII